LKKPSISLFRFDVLSFVKSFVAVWLHCFVGFLGSLWLLCCRRHSHCIFWLLLFLPFIVSRFVFGVCVSDVDLSGSNFKVHITHGQWWLY